MEVLKKLRKKFWVLRMLDLRANTHEKIRNLRDFKKRFRKYESGLEKIVWINVIVVVPKLNT